MSSDASSSLYNDLIALLGVQTVDSQIDRAKSAIAALDTGARTATEYNAKKAETEALHGTSTKAQAEQKDAEMRLASIETKADQVNKTMFGGKVTGSRELDNLQKELDMLGRQKDDGEIKVLEAMEVASDAAAAAKTGDQELAAIADRYRTIRAAYKERHAQLTEEIATHEAERIVAVKPVPAALLTRYDAIRSKKGGIGAASLEADGASCGACHTRLNSTLIDDVVAAKTVQTCEYCGRILVPHVIA